MYGLPQSLPHHCRKADKNSGNVTQPGSTRKLIIDAINSGDRGALTDTLGTAGPEIVPTMTNLLGDPDWRVQVGALAVLSWRGKESRVAENPALRLLQNRSLRIEVPEAAVDALGHLGGGSTKVAEAFISGLRDQTGHRPIRPTPH